MLSAEAGGIGRRLWAAATGAIVVLGIAACGGTAAPASRAGGKAAVRPPGPSISAPRGSAAASGSSVLVAALGDSITAGSPLWDPNPAVRAQIGAQADPTSQYEYWAQRRLGPATRFRNCGVFGERTDQIAQRLTACAAGARDIVIQGGINDIAQGRSVQDAAVSLSSMVSRARTMGLGVAIVEVLPWNNGYPRADPLIRSLNRLIDALARRDGVELIPWYTTLEDPARPGLMRADLTIDGNHPSVAGYRRLAALVRLPPMRGR